MIACMLKVAVLQPTFEWTFFNTYVLIQVENVSRHLEESERALQERIFKLEAQRIQLEEVTSPASFRLAE